MYKINKMKTIAFGVLAVCGLGLAMAPRARAGELQFNYTDSYGNYFTFDQASNPTPSSFDAGYSTQVAVSDWSGNIGPYASIIWYSNFDSGMFDTADHNYQVFGPQVYSGTEANPVFSTGTFYATSESGFPGQGESYCQNQFWGKLTISSVPEPGTLALFAGALGLLGVAVTLRRRARG